MACLATLANGITDRLPRPTDARNKRAAIDRLSPSYGVHFAAIDGKLDALIGGASLS